MNKCPQDSECGEKTNNARLGLSDVWEEVGLGAGEIGDAIVAATTQQSGQACISSIKAQREALWWECRHDRWC